MYVINTVFCRVVLYRAKSRNSVCIITHNYIHIRRRPKFTWTSTLFSRSESEVSKKLSPLELILKQVDMSIIPHLPKHNSYSLISPLGWVGSRQIITVHSRFKNGSLGTTEGYRKALSNIIQRVLIIAESKN